MTYIENIKSDINIQNNTLYKEFKTFSFKNKTIIPFYYNKSLRKILVEVKLSTIENVLNRLEKEVDKINNTFFMKAITKCRLRREMIYKNFRSILDEFKAIIMKYQIPNKISIPLIEDPLGVKLFMSLFISSLMNEVLRYNPKDSDKITQYLDAIDQEGVNIDLVTDYEFRYLKLIVDIIDMYFRELVNKIEKDGSLY